MDKATAVKECQQAFKEYAVELRQEGLIPAKQTDLELGIWFADWGSNWEWRSTTPQHCWQQIKIDEVFQRVTSVGDMLLRILRNEGEISLMANRVKLVCILAEVTPTLFHVKKLTIKEGKSGGS